MQGKKAARGRHGGRKGGGKRRICCGKGRIRRGNVKNVINNPRGNKELSPHMDLIR